MDKVTSQIGPGKLPHEFVSLGALPDADYADLFTLTAPQSRGRSAEEWARAMFEDVGGVSAQLLFRGVLRLRLRRGRGSDRVAGWPITDRGPTWVRLEARSRSMTVHLVVRSEGTTSLATFVRYDRRPGRWLWTPLSARHRAMAPPMLGEADQRLSATAETRL